MITLEDLSEPQRAVLDAIVAGKLACSERATLDQGDDFTATSAAIITLTQLGLIEPWDLPGHLRITLTPYAAWLLEVHILERTTVVGEELSEDPYWAETSQEPRSIHLPKRRHEIRWPWMDELPDPKSVRRAGEVMRDEDGEPVKVLGMEVPVDHRLRGGANQAKARRRAG